MKNKQKEKKYTFKNVIEQYICSVNSQREAYPLIEETLIVSLKNNLRKTSDFIKKYGTDIKEEEGEGVMTFSMPVEHNMAFRKLISNTQSSKLALELIPTNIVMALVSIYDAFIGDLIKTMYSEKPEMLSGCRREMLVSEVLGYNTFDEVKDYVIDKEVESVLRDSHLEHFDWIEKKLKIKLKTDLPSLVDFIEITERRNLFVHAKGVVSRQYLKVCKDNKVPQIEKVKLGSILKADNSYLNKCFDVLLEIGVKLGYVMWSKLKGTEERNEIDSYLNDVCFDLLKEKRYDLAQVLLEFANANTNITNAEIKMIFKINLSLAFYLKGEKEKCTEILSKIDCSILSSKFKLAKAVLLDKNKEACDLMKKIGATDEEISKKAYLEWPLFDCFRKEKMFLDTYKEIFNEDCVCTPCEKGDFSDLVAFANEIRNIESKQIEEEKDESH